MACANCGGTSMQVNEQMVYSQISQMAMTLVMQKGMSQEDALKEATAFVENSIASAKALAEKYQPKT